MKAKIILAEIWTLDLGWDDPLPDNLAETYLAWQEQISVFSTFTIRRHIIPDHEWFLFVFGDASNVAYGIVCYAVDIRNKHTGIILAKGRIAPKNTESSLKTIARLELTAAVLAAQAGEALKQELHFTQAYYFTDSLITLGRIRKGYSSFKTYVANRVKEILRLTNHTQWSFTPNFLNPADYTSRGLDAQQLVKEKLWWDGPNFMLLDKKKWPKQSAITRLVAAEIEEINAGEIQKETIVAVANVCTRSSARKTFIKDLLEKYSTWNKLICVLVYVFRFANNCSVAPSDRIKSTFLTASETRRAEEWAIIHAQSEAFGDESSDILRGDLGKASKLRDYLPFYDDNGVLRAKTRLVQSQTLGKQEVRPIILPKNHRVTDLLVMYYHTTNCHAKGENLLAIIRRKFRIQGTRNTIRRIVHNMCKSRFCNKPVPLQSPQMAPLPTERLDTFNAFEKVSLDFFGPVTANHSCTAHSCPHEGEMHGCGSKVCLHKDDKHKCKIPYCPHEGPFDAYGLIFTDRYSRGIHLELCKSMTTADFLQAFRRLCARRGRPSYCYSDNQSSLKSAARELSRLISTLDWTKIQKRTFGTVWEFGVPHAPWGNDSERAIGTVKSTLRRTLCNTGLSFRELETVLQECEMTVNSRPLSFVGSGRDEPLPISPSMIMLGRELNHIPDDRANIATGSTFTQKWKLRKKILDKSLKAWKNSYLMELALTKKWHRANLPILAVGDVVSIRDPMLLRQEWRIGRVLELHRGKDGQIRQATLKSRKSKLTRKLQLLSKLEGVVLEQLSASQKRSLAKTADSLQTEESPPVKPSPVEKKMRARNRARTQLIVDRIRPGRQSVK